MVKPGAVVVPGAVVIPEAVVIPGAMVIPGMILTAESHAALATGTAQPVASCLPLPLAFPAR